MVFWMPILGFPVKAVQMSQMKKPAEYSASNTLLDELHTRLDFTPIRERTVQQYGVIIDNVVYYDDLLRPYINCREPDSGRNRPKRRFSFKCDPRDTNCIYFLHPETNQYHRISYHNTTHPAISIRRVRQALALFKTGR